MGSDEEEMRRAALQALEELVRVREETVKSLERAIETVEAHVQTLLKAYSSVPAFPPGYDPTVLDEKAPVPPLAEDAAGLKAAQIQSLNGNARLGELVPAFVEANCFAGKKRSRDSLDEDVGPTGKETLEPIGPGKRHFWFFQQPRQRTLDFFFKDKVSSHSNCVGATSKGENAVQDCGIVPGAAGLHPRDSHNAGAELERRKVVDQYSSMRPRNASCTVQKDEVLGFNRSAMATSKGGNVVQDCDIVPGAAGLHPRDSHNAVAESGRLKVVDHYSSMRPGVAACPVERDEVLEFNRSGMATSKGKKVVKDCGIVPGAAGLHRPGSHNAGTESNGLKVVDQNSTISPQVASCPVERDEALEFNRSGMTLKEGHSEHHKDRDDSLLFKDRRTPSLTADVVARSKAKQIANQNDSLRRQGCKAGEHCEVSDDNGEDHGLRPLTSGLTLGLPSQKMMHRGVPMRTQEFEQQTTRGGASVDREGGDVSSISCVLNSNIHEEPIVTWRPKARPSCSSSSSSGESTSGAVSGNEGEEEDEVQKEQEVNLPTKRQGEVNHRRPVRKAAPTLPPDASLEDRFDWLVLGIFSSILWPNRFAKHQRSGSTSLPLTFHNGSHYGAAFQPLVLEECAAIFGNDWEKLRKELGLNQSSSYCLPSLRRARSCSSSWNLEHVPYEEGPFCTIQGHIGSSPPPENCEIVLLASQQTLEIKGVAIVQSLFDKNPVIRTREPWANCLPQCLVLKVSNMVTMKRMFVAVSSLAVLNRSLYNQVLCPRYFDIVSPPVSFLKDWEDRGVFNESQLSAITTALNLQEGFLLVQGPPGTGKTTTIVGMISAFLIKEPGARILICAGSNQALDEVVSRLMHEMVDRSGKLQSPTPGVVVRVGPKAKVRKDCLDVYLDHVLLLQKDAPSRALAIEWTLKSASVVCSTLSGSRHAQLDELKHQFHLAIIDEAAQAAEPEVIIALKKVAGRCILVGDPRQLPATVMQKPAFPFARSLFERMQDAGVPVQLLRTQYRMHPDISQFPSSQFYDNLLEDAEEVHNMKSIFKWETRYQWMSSGGYNFELGRLCFLDVNWGTQQKDCGSASLLNKEEAFVVAGIAEGVMNGLMHGVKASVGVITPYAAQKRTITEALAKLRFKDRMICEVDTVDGFQGREKDVIILSCVRAGGGGGMGFLTDPRRLCVALTRAKHALIIVGHARTLERHSLWRRLLRDAKKRGYFKSLSQCS